MSVFSERLTELMDAQKLSDTKLAEDLNVSRTTVLRWRTGERSPKLPKIKEIADYFGVSPTEFVEHGLLSEQIDTFWYTVKSDNLRSYCILMGDRVLIQKANKVSRDGQIALVVANKNERRLQHVNIDDEVEIIGVATELQRKL